MTAGSWIYIGTQGILQGTYETLEGRLTIRSGLGGMGGAQPLAVTINERGGCGWEEKGSRVYVTRRSMVRQPTAAGSWVGEACTFDVCGFVPFFIMRVAQGLGILVGTDFHSPWSTAWVSSVGGVGGI